MKKSRKILAATLAICIMVLTVFSACSKKPAEKDGEGTSAPPSNQGVTYNIGVIQYVSHSSLDNCYNGIRAALTEKYGENVNIDFQLGSDTSADADCEAYAGTMVAKKYDMIIAIATPAAIAAYAATEGTNIPVVFCSVSDPVAAKIVNSLEAPGTNCTGASDVLDLEGQVNLIRQLQPDVKKIGVLYTTSEVNSITQLEELRKICSNLGIEVDAEGIQNNADLPAAAASLCARVDCLNNFTDNNVVNNLSVVLDAAKNAKIPVYGSEIEQVKKGCLASNSIDYVAVGRKTGEMAASILEGADIKNTPVVTISDSVPVVNSEVLADFNIQLPDALSSVETVVTAE